jgi:hypothetical protein
MKFFLSFLSVALFAVNAYSLPKIMDVEYMLNHNVAGDKVGLGYQVVSNKIQLVKCKYSFAVQGGSISTVTLKGADGASCTIPDNAVVLDSYIDVVTAFAGAGAYLSFSTGKAAADIKALTAIASVTGVLRGIPDGTAAAAIKMTADVVPKMVIASAALTAGVANLYITYVVGD